MDVTTQMAKLAELRIKTDHDLIVVIHNEIERGLTLASVATSRQSPLYLKAERGYREARLCLPRVYSLGPAERAATELKLRELRAALDAVPKAVKVYGNAACQV